MSKTKIIKLDCGVEATSWNSGNTENLEISLEDLYNGYGTLNNIKLLSDLFLELNNKGFVSNGISTIEGYYGSMDDLILLLTRKR